MEIKTLQEDAGQGLIEFSAVLSAEEASTLSSGAYRRLASALHVDEEVAREKARSMLTEMELNVLVEETVKARAADRAIRELGLAFMLHPSIRSAAPFEEGSPFSIEATANPIPFMDLDLSDPIVPADGERESNPEKLVLRALRARLAGTVPASLENAALRHETDSFRKGLEKSRETYREYRIRTGKKPQEVEADLRRAAMRRLHEEIALETVFRKQDLALTREDEERTLSSMAPGKESDLRGELDNAGKLWMLTQETRRKIALRWSVEHLLR